MIKAVLFDFDGTLVDTLDLYILAYNAALKEIGFNWDAKQIVSDCFGKTEEEICVGLGMPEKTEVFRNRYYDAIKEIFVDAKLFDDVEPILSFLQKQKYKIGIITFSRRWYIDAMLEKFKLNEFFDGVISDDEVEKAKPDPEGVLKLSKLLNVDPKDAIVIGDSKSDILMGNSAGSKTALILREKDKDIKNIEDLLKSKPTFVIKNLVDLKKRLTI